VHCMTRLRSGTLAPSSNSLTQLCGRFGPTKTLLPVGNDR
jgi:hypothetical protein